jgi:MFS family permease
MFSGYAIACAIWIVYGTTRNLGVFLVFSVLEGIAMAWANPAKQAFLVQVSPRRWVGTVQGMETTAAHLAAFVGTLAAPFLFEHISGRVIAVSGVVALVAIAATAPILGAEWKRLTGVAPPAAQPEVTGG